MTAQWFEDLDLARSGCEAAARIVDRAAATLAEKVAKDGRVSVSLLDQHQLAAFELGQMLSRLEAARSVRAWAERVDAPIARALATSFAAETVLGVHDTLARRSTAWELDATALFETLGGGSPSADLVARGLAPEQWEAIAAHVLERGAGPYGLDSEREMIRTQFRRFAQEQVRPVAEHVHRTDELIPQAIIQAVAELGCFGLSIPEQYGGLQPDDRPDNIGMCIVTEELSRASLGVAGSLITRPEILSKALLKGGTEAQKERWLPALAMGEAFCAVAVTEPDFGSDVAGMKVAATRADGGWLLNGQKTWCTFGGYADVLMVLARTDPEPARGHRGLSIVLAEKPRDLGHEFEHHQDGGGRMAGKAIDTIGYRGMHSFDVFFEDWFVPDSHVIGEADGLGRGFYYQMEGFSGGRLQTAARATGVMQAALDEAIAYARERRVFGRPIADYQLTAWKLARMAMTVQTARQFTWDTARRLDAHEGQLEASMVKLWASREAEWVTREAMQIHGGMGYAEEYAVSRYFVDARVFSIFEGAEEVLALRVVARQVLQRHLDRAGGAA